MDQNTYPQSVADIKNGLAHSFQAVATYLSEISEEKFQLAYQDKWTAAEHIGHLTLASFPVASALKQSKFVFKMFGSSKNGSRSFEELLAAYKDRLANGQRADDKTTPKATDIGTKEEMVKNWNSILQKLLDRMDNWSDSDLDTYRVPHPALGKITIRELLMFTIFHTDHHLDILKARIN